MNDPKDNFQTFRWIDNIVKMVSNVHMGTKDEAVMKPRKKPRINEFNRKHIRLVWGDENVVSIKIPTIINDTLLANMNAIVITFSRYYLSQLICFVQGDILFTPCCR